MQSELEARERAGAAPQPPASKHQQRSPCSPGTAAAALFANNSSPNCTYCRSPHPSSNCTTVTNIDARNDVLRKSGRCFICLRRNHISRVCRSNARCYKCGGRQHISICSTAAGATPPNGERPRFTSISRTDERESYSLVRQRSQSNSTPDCASQRLQEWQPRETSGSEDTARQWQPAHLCDIQG